MELKKSTKNPKSTTPITTLFTIPTTLNDSTFKNPKNPLKFRQK